MRHPAGLLGRGSGQQPPAVAHGQLRAPELTHLGPFDPPAQRKGEQLHPVTDAKHGHAELEQLALALGGQIEAAEVGEFGRSQLTVSDSGRLLAGTPDEQTCWMSHRDTVFAPPPGFTALASSTASPVAAFESVQRGIYGIQFHPEVVHTPYGQRVLTNFLADVCGCERSWSPRSVIDEQIDRIRAQVGDGRAICGLSGGVDSNAATGDAVDEASAVNPGGGANTVSRWDIQQVCSSGVPASSLPVWLTVSWDRPNSPTSAPSIRPPRASASNCIP